MTAIKDMVKLQTILGSKSPFISEELYNDFMSIKELLSKQVSMYTFCGPLERKKSTYDKVAANEETKAYSRTDDIKARYKDIVIKMRSYFNSLEIKRE